MSAFPCSFSSYSNTPYSNGCQFLDLSEAGENSDELCILLCNKNNRSRLNLACLVLLWEYPYVNKMHVCPTVTTAVQFSAIIQQLQRIWLLSLELLSEWEICWYGKGLQRGLNPFLVKNTRISSLIMINKLPVGKVRS